MMYGEISDDNRKKLSAEMDQWRQEAKMEAEVPEMLHCYASIFFIN